MLTGFPPKSFERSSIVGAFGRLGCMADILDDVTSGLASTTVDQMHPLVFRTVRIMQVIGNNYITVMKTQYGVLSNGHSNQVTDNVE